MGRRNYAFDANMLLSDGGNANAAAGWATVGGTQAIIDLGGNQGITVTLPSIADSTTYTPQQARFDGVVVIYVTAITLAGSDLYRIALAGSNNAGLLSSNAVLGELNFGTASGIVDVPNAAATTAAPGSTAFPQGEQFELLFTNEQYGTVYEFISLYVSGTFGSITFSAFAAVLPRQ